MRSHLKESILQRIFQSKNNVTANNGNHTAKFPFKKLFKSVPGVILS